jgi:hypothetical protein
MIVPRSNLDLRIKPAFFVCGGSPSVLGSFNPIDPADNGVAHSSVRPYFFCPEYSLGVPEIVHRLGSHLLRPAHDVRQGGR